MVQLVFRERLRRKLVERICDIDEELKECWMPNLSLERDTLNKVIKTMDRI
jgi:hypothetical protein